MRWIVQKLNEDDYKLVETIRNLGIDVDFIDLEVIYNHKELIAKDEPVVIHSSIDSFRHLLSTYNFKHLYPEDKLKCTDYFAYWGNKCFNHEGVFLPIGEAVRRFEDFQTLWSNKSIFVKPNTNDKTFSGEVFTDSDDLEHYIKYEIMAPQHLVLVAPSYHIEKEWRVVLKAQNVIASSLYKTDHKLTVEPNTEANWFAESIVPYEGLPVIYILDIAQDTNKNFFVMEPGSINVAGFYACDLQAIVKAVSKEMEFAYTKRDDNWFSGADSARRILNG